MRKDLIKIYVDNELKLKLNAECDRLDCSRSGYINSLLESLFNQKYGNFRMEYYVEDNKKNKKDI